MSQSINTHCKNCQSLLKILIKDSPKTSHWFCEVGRTCPFTIDAEPIPEQEIVITIEKPIQNPEPNNFVKVCKWCGGRMRLIPASEHWTKKTQNKCMGCFAIDNRRAK